MANYNLETETTVHVKGMTVGDSPETGGGKITVYIWSEISGGLLGGTRTDYCVVLDSSGISLYHNVPLSQDYCRIKTDGSHLADVRVLYVNPSAGYAIPDGAQKITVDNIRIEYQ